jgi:propionyl-CoA carboxylase alpha chain/3-methylcrotonyl-CoA carboxylase alpha subunit
MSEAAREAVTRAAVRAARAVGYVGAGTVEFIADASEGLKPDRIWFMEMNTRLQVEHPVTEAVTGVDLVEWQIRVAAGEPLPLGQDQIKLSGHAVEARLYAENPAGGFLPSIGALDHFRLPEDLVRIDTGVEEGGEVSPYYDPMIAKLIAHARTREGASDLLAQACSEVEVWPVKTNAGFLARCLDHPDFIAGDVDTGFIETRLDELVGRPEPSKAALAAAAMALTLKDEADAPAAPWTALTGFRLNADPVATMPLYLGEQGFDAPLYSDDVPDDVLLTEDGEVVVFDAGEAFVLTPRPPVKDAAHRGGGDGTVASPMPGKVVAVSVAVGDAVTRGQTLLTLEAMKMEHALAAPFDGVVEVLSVSVGDQVSEGVALARLKEQ